MPTIHLVCQENSSSGLPRYLKHALTRIGHNVNIVDAQKSVLANLLVLLQSVHPNRKTWSHRHSMLRTYSAKGWHRNTRVNGRILDRNRQPEDKVLQIGGLFAPHPNAAALEYYLFFTYTMQLAFQDGYSRWVPDYDQREKFVELERQLYLGARHIFVSAAFVRRHLIEHYGICGSRISVVGMGVDDFFVTNARYELPETAAGKCLFVGYTFDLKGGSEVLNGFSLARQQLPWLELIIVGPNHTPEMDREGVRYLGAVQDRIELLNLYRCADLFLLPSRCDSFGFVFLEAMTQGLACVGSRMNAMPEIIAEGDTGYLVEPGDHQGLAQAIIDFYQSPQKRAEMGERGRERVLTRFTWSKVVEGIQAVMWPDLGLKCDVVPPEKEPQR